MTAGFYIAGSIAVLATLMVITRLHAVHALLYLVVSLLAVAVVFFALGASFVAALEVIVYAGAIMVLFVFVIMMLNLGGQMVKQELLWMGRGIWVGPGLLCAALLTVLVVLMLSGAEADSPNPMTDAASAVAGAGQTARTGQMAGAGQTGASVSPKEVGISLYGPYLLGVELTSMLLLAGLVAAWHVGRRDQDEYGRPKEGTRMNEAGRTRRERGELDD